MADDLNPCPLCGSADGYRVEHHGPRWSTRCAVACVSCDAVIAYTFRDDPPGDARASWQDATKHHAAALARVAALEAENAALRADAERLDYIASHARCDPKMCGNHVWWPTNFKHRLIGPTLRAAIDAAREARDA